MRVEERRAFLVPEKLWISLNGIDIGLIKVLINQNKWAAFEWTLGGGMPRPLGMFDDKESAIARVVFEYHTRS